MKNTTVFILFALAILLLTIAGLFSGYYAPKPFVAPEVDTAELWTNNMLAHDYEALNQLVCQPSALKTAKIQTELEKVKDILSESGFAKLLNAGMTEANVAIFLKEEVRGKGWYNLALVIDEESGCVAAFYFDKASLWFKE